MSSQTCFSKSANKHNKLYAIAEPISNELVDDIESGEITPNDDQKVTARKLIDKFIWEQHDARKL
jgi:elongation factor 2